MSSVPPVRRNDRRRLSVPSTSEPFPSHPLHSRPDFDVDSLPDVAMSARSRDDPAFEADALLHMATRASRNRDDHIEYTAPLPIDTFALDVTRSVPTDATTRPMAAFSTESSATSADGKGAASSSEPAGAQERSSGTAGAPASAGNVPAARTVLFKDSAATVAKQQGAAADDDCIIVEVSHEGGEIVINSPAVTIKCDSNFTFVDGASGKELRLTAEQTKALAKSLVIGGPTHTQVNAVPAAKRPNPVQRLRALVRRPTRAESVRAVKVAVVVALIPKILRFCRSARVRMRTRHALEHGHHDALQRLLTSRSEAVRCAAVHAVTFEAHKINAGQLWQEGAFAPVPDHELSRSPSSSLTKCVIPALPKPRSASRMTPSDTPPLLDLDAVAAAGAEPRNGHVFGKVVASELAAKLGSDGVLSTLFAELKRMLAGRCLKQKILACSCVQRLAFSGDRLTQQLVDAGVIPELISLMRDRNGTRTRGFATLRQHDLGPPHVNVLELVRRSPFYLPQLTYNTNNKAISIIPRGCNWNFFPGLFLLPKRLDQRNGLKRQVRRQAAEALQNMCAVRSACKAVLECDGLTVIVELLWTGDTIGQLAAVEALYSVVSHFPNCRNLVYSLAGDYALSSVSHSNNSSVVHAACTKTLVKLRPDRSLLPSDNNQGYMYR